MMQVTFTRKFSAAHRLWEDVSICENIHGHNYRAEITVESAIEVKGMVLPAEKVKQVVDHLYDHRIILQHNDPLYDVLKEQFPQTYTQRITITEMPPTTETLAAAIACDIRDQVIAYSAARGKGRVVVTLHETDTISATMEVVW